LNHIFGNYRAKGIEKGGYVLARNMMTCADLSRIINSDTVQSKLRGVKTHEVVHDIQKKNPLHNRALMRRLNPFHEKKRELEKKLQEERHKKRVAALKGKRKDKGEKKKKQARNKLHHKLQADLTESYQHALNELAKEENLDNMESEEEEADK